MARHVDTETRGACLSAAASIVWLCAAGLIAVVFGKLLANEAPSLPLAGAGLPLVILVIAFWHSWAVGLVLLFAGPLIPLFMALVGWAAKDASARQMQEIGELNDFLVDRLAALG